MWINEQADKRLLKWWISVRMLFSSFLELFVCSKPIRSCESDNTTRDSAFAVYASITTFRVKAKSTALRGSLKPVSWAVSLPLNTPAIPQFLVVASQAASTKHTGLSRGHPLSCLPFFLGLQKVFHFKNGVKQKLMFNNSRDLVAKKIRYY